MKKLGYLDDETAIRQNLKDAGCCREQIDALLKEIKKGNVNQGLKTLSEHRCCLLDTLHKEQRCIDCLDYLVYRIKKENDRL